jgi:hypothetical protein
MHYPVHAFQLNISCQEQAGITSWLSKLGLFASLSYQPLADEIASLS